MAYSTLTALLIVITTVLAAPVNNEQLDKATVNDISINSVSEERRAAEVNAQVVPQLQNAAQSTVEITGITTGASGAPAAVPDTPVLDNQPFKPQRTGSMFARFIDDIFQIPINVLQNVARLITSPFTQKKTPEVVATIS